MKALGWIKNLLLETVGWSILLIWMGLAKLKLVKPPTLVQ